MQISRLVKIVLSNQSGMAFLESLAALAILGMIAVTCLSGLATNSKAVLITDERATAESLARSQLEYTKNYAYQTDASDYPVDPSLTIPDNWSVPPPVAEPTHESDDGIQKITVSVERNGETIFVIQGYKVDR
jgi:type II secretory pathway pseudopilin PulG